MQTLYGPHPLMIRTRRIRRAASAGRYARAHYLQTSRAIRYARRELVQMECRNTQARYNALTIRSNAD